MAVTIAFELGLGLTAPFVCCLHKYFVGLYLQEYTIPTQRVYRLSDIMVCGWMKGTITGLCTFHHSDVYGCWAKITLAVLNYRV